MGPGHDAPWASDDARAGPILPPPNTWADPLGPGRCPRCHLWLDDDHTCIWMVRHRDQEEAFGRIGLCEDCTRDMISWWRVETWKPDPPKTD
jgi:hypothetical protein